MTPFRLACFALVVASSGGCGGSSDGGGGGSELSAEELPKAFAGAFCDKMSACSGGLFDLFLAEDCGELLGGRLEQSFAGNLDQAISEGRTSYDPALGAACIDEIRGKTCEELLQRSSDACDGALTGSVETGGDCTQDYECMGGDICLFGDTCPGSCGPRRSAGQGCDADDNCADGLVCSEATARCVAPAAVGAACGGGVEPQCTPGTFCVGEDDEANEPGECQALDEAFSAAVGADCSFDGPLCGIEHSCVIEGIEENALVTTCQARAAIGGSCGLGLPSQCPQGQYCPLTFVDLAQGTVTSECVDLPAAGEPCAENPVGPVCGPFARCDAGGTCRNLRNLGESCDDDEMCASGVCVDGGCTATRCEE